jgi:hypothetical protein
MLPTFLQFGLRGSMSELGVALGFGAIVLLGMVFAQVWEHGSWLDEGLPNASGRGERVFRCRRVVRAWS